MKALPTDKVMTTKQVAEALHCDIKTVRENAKKCLPNKVIAHGKPTFWTEKEVTVLLDFMKRNNNRTDLTCTTVVQVASTSLTPALKLKKALELAQEAYEEELERIKAETARITQERDGLQIKLDTSKEWASVKRMESLNPNRKFNWRVLKAKAVEMGVEIKKVFDQNYGEINSYHKSVWESCYELDECPWD